MKIGDKITCRTEIGLLPGIVCFVDPKGRFYTVEFCLEYKESYNVTRERKFKESFPLVGGV